MRETPKKKKKLIIIGIDGGTFKIIDPLVERGKLPALEKLIKSGVKGVLKSTCPPITAAAWVSFMTGTNPGKHGFFDFREYNPAEYDLIDSPLVKDAVKENISTLHSSRFQGQTIWDFLSNAGYEINVVAFPMTYPPWKINGRMVSGYPCPDYSNPRTYPEGWGREIGQLFNMSAINYSDIEGFVKECKELVKRKGKIILDQIKNKRGDVFSVVFSSSDFAQHYFWKYLEEKNNQNSSVIGEIYQEIDNVIGEILNFADSNTSVFVMSDHGFTGYPEKKFHLNSWLVQENYISLKQNKKDSEKNIISQVIDIFFNQIRYKNPKLRWFVKKKIGNMPLFLQRWASRQYFKSSLIDWERTKAYRFKMYGPVDGVVINQKDRQKKGTVGEGDEYEKLRQEIIEKLLHVKDPDTGEPVVAAAFRREEIYRGCFLEKAPDIIVNYTPGYFGGLEITGHFISPVNIDETNESGIHDQNGIFICCGPNVKTGATINPVDIIDVVPTILHDLTLPIPDDIDGKVIKEVFCESYKANVSRYTSGLKAARSSKEVLSEEDEESIKKALKNLGYLG